MKKTLIFSLLFSLLSLLLLAYVLGTESGLRLVADSGVRLSQGKLKIGEIHGTLLKRFTISGFDYTDSALAIGAEKIIFSWSPISLMRGDLHLNTLSLQGVHMQQKKKEKAAQSTKQDFSLPRITLPLGVIVEKLDVSDITIDFGTGTVTEIDSLQLEMNGKGDTLDLKMLRVRTADNVISLTGRMELSDQWNTDITGTWTSVIPGYPEISGTCALSGPAAEAIFEVALLSPFSAAAVSQIQISETVRWHTKISVEGFDPAFVNKDYPGVLDALMLIDGEFKDETVTMKLDLKQIEGKIGSYPVTVRGQAGLVDDVVEISEIEGKSGNSTIVLRGTIGNDLDLVFELVAADIKDFAAQASGSIRIAGAVKGQREAPVLTVKAQGDAITVQGVSIAAMTADGEGGLNTKTALSGHIHVTDVKKESNHLQSVDLQLSGTLENHSVTLELLENEVSATAALQGRIEDKRWIGDIEAVEIVHPVEGRLKLINKSHVAVSGGHASLDSLCLGHEAGQMCLSGKYTDGSWQAEARLEAFNPVFFNEDWPGKMNAEIVAWREKSEESGSSHIILRSLSGTLRGQEVMGRGMVELGDSIIRFQDVSLGFGDAQLDLTGSLSEDLDFQFDGKIPEISELFEEYEGSFQLSGQVKGKRSGPVVNVDFAASNGKAEGIALGGATGHVSADLRPGGTIAANIHGTDISAGEVSLDSVDFLADGTTENHSFQLSASSNKGEITLLGEGGYTSSWLGNVREAEFKSEQYGSYAVQGENQFDIGPERSRVVNLCLEGEKASACFDGSFAEDRGWSVTGKIKSLVLSLLENLGLSPIPIDGDVRGNVAIAMEENRITTFSLEAESPHILLGNENEAESMTYSLQQSRVSTQLIDGNLQIDLSSRLEKEGSVRGRIFLQDLILMKDNMKDIAIGGEIDVAFNDLSVISILTESAVNPTGKVNGTVRLGGKIGRPLFEGNLVLEDGGMAIPALGIDITSLAASISADSDTLSFESSGTSGPGRLRASGNVRLDEGASWLVTTHFTGKDFLLVSTEEYQIRVNPDVHLEANGRGSKIWGDLVVPYARIAIEGGGGTISPSDDVVFVDQAVNEDNSKTALTSDIKIILGDDVQFEAYSLKSRLEGQLTLNDVPGKTLTALGELVFKEGKYELYSTELDIVRGRLLFTGGPVDDPGVDMRAQRKIESKIVGVIVSGTISSLDLQLFSDPMMEESDILAYILVGKSMSASNDDDESLIGAAVTALGIGGANLIFSELGSYIPIDEIYLEGSKSSEDMSLVLGKNITEDFFIGYGHNFFDSSGEFKIRYRLGYGFSFETKSSASVTSGDLLYIIER